MSYYKISARKHICSIFKILILFMFSDVACAQSIRIRINERTNGFHLSEKYLGKSIVVEAPENEHVIYAIEDMVQLLGVENDILVGQVEGLDNALAFIDNSGKGGERRMILIEKNWQMGPYRVILAHEMGHHICKHSLNGFLGAPTEKELEADRAGGALLRLAYDKNVAIGGDLIDYKTMLNYLNKTPIANSVASETHPDGEKRVAAYKEGWQNGSSCLKSKYIPINPVN